MVVKLLPNASIFRFEIVHYQDIATADDQSLEQTLYRTENLGISLFPTQLLNTLVRLSSTSSPLAIIFDSQTQQDVLSQSHRLE